MTRLLLYTTLGCHLCERAKEIVKSSKYAESIELELIEIADSTELMKSYGISIPVIKIAGREEEIGWPFDTERFENWFTENLDRQGG